MFKLNAEAFLNLLLEITTTSCFLYSVLFICQEIPSVIRIGSVQF